MDTWVTLAAHDTPFLAQLVTDRLDEAGIAHRTLSDSGGGNLPHIDFGAGGHRVQVDREDLAAARQAIAALPAEVMEGLDVGHFSQDAEGVVPDPQAAADGHRPARPRRGLRLAAVVMILLVTAIFLLGPLDVLPRLLDGTLGR